MIKALFKPLRYLEIKVETGGKSAVDFILPAIISLLISIALTCLNFSLDINIFVGDSALSKDIIGIISTLPGFYIASLAAVATFPSSAMDDPMPPPAPHFEENSSTPEAHLSRRRFLSHMFSFLAYITIFCYLLTSAISFAYTNFYMLKASVWVFLTIYFFCSFIIFFICSQILLLTLVGLWYLGERIHFNNPIGINNDLEHYD